MIEFKTLEDLVARKGEEVGLSDWLTITQADIDQFAQVTGDMQWIHVDVERAANGPFKRTISHGFLTLSLVPKLMAGIFEIKEPSTGVNYGLNKVRFMAPVLSDTAIRARATLMDATPVGENGYQFAWKVELEQEGADKPACVVEWLIRRYR